MEAAEFQDILDAVRAFVRDEVVPREDEIEEKDAIPADLREKAEAMGLFGYALPEEHGGLGFSMTEDVRLAMELGYASPAFRSLFATTNGIAGRCSSTTAPRNRSGGTSWTRVSRRRS